MEEAADPVSDIPQDGTVTADFLGREVLVMWSSNVNEPPWSMQTLR